jgi:hypothetical protein
VAHNRNNLADRSKTDPHHSHMFNMVSLGRFARLEPRFRLRGGFSVPPCEPGSMSDDRVMLTTAVTVTATHSPLTKV